MLPRLGLQLCLLLIAATAAAHGTHQARLAEADRRIAEAPGNPDHYRARSVLHREQGDLESARKWFAKAIELDQFWKLPQQNLESLPASQ